MQLAELLPIAGALSAPAFFLLFALAALGAPLLSLVCLLAAQLRSTQHPEAYARRLLRMALSCAMPAMLDFAGAAALCANRAPWLLDWLRAAPLVPALFVVGALAYCALLLSLRFANNAPGHRRQGSRLGQSAVLALLALALLWLGQGLVLALADQAQAVLRSPMDGGIGVAPLLAADPAALPAHGWAALTALAALCMASAGAVSLEYLVLLRDREPFGREALAHMLRLAARSTLRSVLLAGAFLPALWMRLPEMPALPGGHQAARLLLDVCAGALLLVCLCAGRLARSTRPWEHGLTIHTALICLWAGLTLLLSVGLLSFYAV